MTEYIIKVRIYDNGVKTTCNSNNQLHSFNDEPAVICSDGAKSWYKDGKLHRDNDEPAVIHSDGAKHWYKDDKLHRDNDEPAVITPSGIKEYYKNGKRYTPAPKATTCDGKVVEIDGKKYKLTEV
jgi:hypothetical protein